MSVTACMLVLDAAPASMELPKKPNPIRPPRLRAPPGTTKSIRSRAWLEQMVARATRVDLHGGPYAEQRATVFHPDDPLFARFRHSIETEQGTLAKRPRPKPGVGSTRFVRFRWLDLSGDVGLFREGGVDAPVGFA